MRGKAQVLGLVTRRSPREKQEQLKRGKAYLQQFSILSAVRCKERFWQAGLCPEKSDQVSVRSENCGHHDEKRSSKAWVFKVRTDGKSDS